MAPTEIDPALARAAAAYKRFFDEVRKRFPERAHIVEQIELALLAREHALVFGPPGTGKSELASTVLRNVVDTQGKPSLYARQIVETTVQQDLVGPVDFKVLTETGRTTHRVDEGLLAFEHAVLDEAFDARDLLLRSLFSVLHEREFAVGPEVIKARLGTALFTTNRYLSELLAARPETLLAFSDRVAFAGFVPKGFVEGGSRMAVLATAAGRTPPLIARLALEELALLRHAVHQVEVPDEALSALASFADLYERLIHEPQDRKQPPTRYLSGRALAKAVGIWKAAVLRDRMLGRERKILELKATPNDLGLLRPFFALAGPPLDRLDAYGALTNDPRDQAQLRLVGQEQAIFNRALKELQGQLKQELQREAAELGLAEIFRPDMAANRALVGSLAANALARARHAKHREELTRLLQSAAHGYLAEGPKPLSSDAQLERVGQVRLMIDGLRTGGDEELARKVAIAARAEVGAEVLAVPLTEAAEEFEAQRPTSLRELAVQAQRRLEAFDSAEQRIIELSGLVGESSGPEVSALISSARARTARALRRRAGALVTRPRAGGDLASLPNEVAPLAEIDALLAKLSPGSGRLRQDLVTARAAGLLRRELVAVSVSRVFDLLEFVRDAERRLRTLEIDAGPVLRSLRPAVSDRLQGWLRLRPPATQPKGQPNSEDGYINFIAQCRASSERVAVVELIRLVNAEGDQAMAGARAKLEELDVAEVSAQVAYLEEWFTQVSSSIPPPGDLASLPQAESAWAVVSSSRFYRQAWRDQELVTLRERIRELGTLPSVGAKAKAVGERLENLLRQSEHFGRALLDRRAALSSAA
ncbi:MAG: AAA family ATPase [Deltaproteobacteria bacterium]|nr:AAA family ATPase [Deltaproteobacteria bacterium]